MVDVSKTVEQMTDDELAELSKLAELIKDAERERERRSADGGGARSVPLAQTRVRRTTKAPCPSCGRTDSAIETKTLYEDDSLARGRVVGTAAFCGQCRVWFNAGTGERADMRHTY